MKIYFSESFDYSRSMTSKFGIRLCGFAYDEELANSDGMHYHVWIDGDSSRDRLETLFREIRRERDIVSLSWSKLEGIA